MSGHSKIRPVSIIAAILCSISFLNAQPFSPAAGLEGSAALHADDASFSAWALTCELERGPGLIGYPDSIEVSNGEAGFATGKAGDEVVSLGDGGRATLSFEHPIMNGPGPDFAVFENSFDGNFLELGFVEVSSDNQHFVRFPSSSLTPVDKQIGPFGILDPEKIHNLAGKYSSGWGVPFDLEDLKDSAGLNINSITAVRVIDVIGILDEKLGSRDAMDRLINDPFPTPFETCGFDLDAVGVIHSSMPSSINDHRVNEGIEEIERGIYPELKLFPNPCQGELNIEFPEGYDAHWILLDMNGRALLRNHSWMQKQRISLENIPDGVYFIQSYSEGTTMVKRIIKNSR